MFSLIIAVSVGISIPRESSAGKTEQEAAAKVIQQFARAKLSTALKEKRTADTVIPSEVPAALATLSEASRALEPSRGECESHSVGVLATVSRRPIGVQKEVDLAFDCQKDSSADCWGYDGSNGFYHLMGIDEEKIIREIASRDDDNQDVYLMDVGAGQGSWGSTAERLLKTEFAHSKKHFHIISVTGGKELSCSTQTSGNVTHYCFNQLKIENIEPVRKSKTYCLKE